jgi:hypothetical protein
MHCGFILISFKDISQTVTAYYLAYAIYIIRQTDQAYSGSAECHREDLFGAWRKTLKRVCKLDTRRNLPEPQHELCIYGILFTHPRLLYD